VLLKLELAVTASIFLSVGKFFGGSKGAIEDGGGEGTRHGGNEIPAKNINCKKETVQ
jgi:hypothetical protein